MSEPTYQDANLMLQIAQWWAVSGVNKAINWMWSDEFIPDYPEFVEKFPVGSKKYGRATLICGAMETLGTLYKHSLFNEELLFDWLAVSMVWERIKGFALGLREVAGEPRLYENFEAMAKAEPG